MNAMKITSQDLVSLPLIHEGRHSFIYLHDTTGDGKPVAVKLLKNPKPLPEDIFWFANEYKLTKDMAVPGVRRAYDSITIEGRPALILEYIEGKTLRESFVEERRSLAEVLTAAMAIAGILNGIHRLKIVHKKISSANILAGSDQAVTLIDFEIASHITNPGNQAHGPELLEELLPYISPEQTGRMNRSIDHRSDLYSFGVLLYEMLTGRLPFAETSAAALVHCHIAGSPRPVHEVNPYVPQTVSDIVTKLMAKNPEDRYQSAYGVKADFETCLEQLEKTGRIKGFALGKDDYSETLRITQKLFGRESELKILINALERVSKGPGEVILISGPAGVGKSSLISGIQGRIAERGGYFIKGEHNQSQRNIPYSALLQAFTGMIDLILTEPADQLVRWKTRLTQAVGVDGAVLIEMLPRLKLIIGEQPPAPAPGPIEARVHNALRNLVLAMAGENHPLVLCIDNMQWLDPASLLFLKMLLAGAGNRFFLFVGTYRDTEVDPSHPLMALVDDLKRQKNLLKRIHLGNLASGTLQALVADAIQCKPAYAKPLAAIVHEKTGGNPLFAVQFMQAVSEAGALFFDPGARKWKWDLGRIRDTDITDNVATLMVRKIEKLPRESRELLSQAACIGSSFETGILAAIAKTSVRETLDGLRRAVEEGLIRPLDGNHQLMTAPEADLPAGRESRFEFLHDRIRNAAQSFFPRKERRAIHLNIGRLKLQRARGLTLEEEVFEIVDHLNEGFVHITDEQERLRMVELNLMAGRRAKRTAAYQAAIWYLSMGIGMLPREKWRLHLDLTLDLYVEAVEAEYLCANFERADLLSAEVLLQAKDPSVKVKIYEFRDRFHRARDQGVVVTHEFEDLERRYKELRTQKQLSPLDTSAVIRASHMLAQEIRLEQLLDRLIHIVIENAGAEKGILIEEKNGELLIQAKGEIARKKIRTMQEIPMGESGEVPISVVNYVVRTQTPVLLDSAVEDSVYASDAYIAEHMTKSLLCLPIVHQAKLMGVLYLENNLTTGVFTLDHLELLKVLSSQAAISMENARLYVHLENKVAELQKAESELQQHQEYLEKLVEQRTSELTDTNVRLLREIEERKKIEEALNKRLIALTEPLETADISFADLFNLEDIQKIQDAFAEATQVASLIVEPDGTPITRPSKFCRLCMDIIRKTEKGRKNCAYSDSIIGSLNPEGPNIQPCLSGGLWDAGATITVGGKHIASWLVGQVKNEAIDEEKIVRYAAEIGTDEEEFRKALKEVPVMSLEQFRKITDAVFILAKELSLKAYQNVQQARFITKRRQAEMALQEREEQLRTLINAMPDLVIFKDAEGRYLESNDFNLRFFGLEGVDYRGKTDNELAEYTSFYHHALRGCQETDDAAWQAKTLSRSDEVIPRPDGSSTTFDLIKVPTFHRDGSRKGLVVVGRDITDRKEAEEALRGAHAELERRVEERTAELKAANVRLVEEVEERKKVEKGLRRAEEEKSLLLNSTMDLVVYHALDMRILWANRVAADSVNMTQDELKGRYCWEIWHQRSEPCIGCPVLLARETGLPHMAELFSPDGRAWFIRGYPLKDDQGRLMGLAEFCLDITERKRSEAAEKLNTERLQALLQLNQMTDATLEEITTFALDKAVRLTRSRLWYLAFLNEDESVLTMHAWSKSAMEECAITEKPIHFPVETTGLWGEAVRQRRPIITNDYSAPNPLKKGYPKGHVKIRRHMNVPVIVGSKIVLIAGVGNKEQDYDETDVQQMILLMEGMWRLIERNRANAELMKHRDHLWELVKERTSELIDAKEKAEAANQAKNVFLSSMSHELRTPLNAILGFTQILKRQKNLTDNQQKQLGTVQESGEHLLNLINDILDVGKIEAQRLEIQESVFNLPALLRQVFEMSKPKAEEKGLGFEYESLSLLPDLVRGDERKLKQVLLNLLSNAVKYTRQGGVTLRADYRAEGEIFCCEVVDTGVGIPKDKQKDIFEPFVQLEADGQVREGTGLGLTISKKLVSIMQGSIVVESAPGKGSIFRVEIPLSEVSGVEIPLPKVSGVETPRKERERDIIGYQGRTRRILVVDDNATNASLLVSLLEPLGFEVTTALNGKEAVRRALDQPPDLMLLDLFMPGMNGLEVTRTIREHKNFKDTRIIGVSATVTDSGLRGTFEQACDAFLGKPFHVSLLFDQIQKQLGVEWKYQVTEISKAISVLKHDASVVIPPQEELQDLLQLARVGNMARIEEWAAALEKGDSAYAPFTRKLRRLAGEFKTRAILSMVEQALKTGPQEPEEGDRA